MTELVRIPFKGGPLAGTFTSDYTSQPPDPLVPEGIEGAGAYRLYITIEGKYAYQWRWATIGAEPGHQGYEQVLWRVGRKVGRTIYAKLGDRPSDSDPFIGTMDTRELAEEAVRAHNIAWSDGL